MLKCWSGLDWVFAVWSDMQLLLSLPQNTDAEVQPEGNGSGDGNEGGADADMASGSLVSVVSSMIGSAVRHLSGDDLSIVTLNVAAEHEEEEKQFEAALSHQFV